MDPRQRPLGAEPDALPICGEVDQPDRSLPSASKPPSVCSAEAAVARGGHLTAAADKPAPRALRPARASPLVSLRPSSNSASCCRDDRQNSPNGDWGHWWTAPPAPKQSCPGPLRISGEDGRVRHENLQLLVTRGESRQIKLPSGAQADVDGTSDPTLGRRRHSQRHLQCVPAGAASCLQRVAKRPSGLPTVQVPALRESAENERLLGSRTVVQHGAAMRRQAGGAHDRLSYVTSDRGGSVEVNSLFLTVIGACAESWWDVSVR